MTFCSVFASLQGIKYPCEAAAAHEHLRAHPRLGTVQCASGEPGTTVPEGNCSYVSCYRSRNLNVFRHNVHLRGLFTKLSRCQVVAPRCLLSFR